MKNKTIFTKPLRVPDAMPSRVTKSIELTEENGKITEIKDLNSGTTVSVGGNDRSVKCEWLTEYNKKFVDQGESTCAIDVIGVIKISDERIDELLKHQELFQDVETFFSFGIGSTFENTRDEFVKNLGTPAYKEILEKYTADGMITNLNESKSSYHPWDDVFSYFRGLGFYVNTNTFFIKFSKGALSLQALIDYPTIRPESFEYLVTRESFAMFKLDDNYNIKEWYNVICFLSD